MADDDDEKPKTSTIFGQDLASIPCFRQTFLTSISASLFTGFAYFMFTSRTRHAVHVGYGTFFGVTLGYWIYCRYQYACAKHMQMQTKAAIAMAAEAKRTGKIYEASTHADNSDIDRKSTVPVIKDK